MRTRLPDYSAYLLFASWVDAGLSNKHEEHEEFLSEPSCPSWLLRLLPGSEPSDQRPRQPTAEARRGTLGCGNCSVVRTSIPEAMRAAAARCPRLLPRDGYGQ